MKKIFLSVALMLAVGIGAAFAQHSNTISRYVQTSLIKNFSTAKDISWKETKNYDEATFTLDGQVLTAYYTGSHHPFAISRNISTTQLPLSLLGDIKRNFAAYWVSDLFELMINGHSEYYVTLEKADKKIILKSDDTRNWTKYDSSIATQL